MQYCITINNEFANAAEALWARANLTFECIGAGCGSCEYEFITTTDRTRAQLTLSALPSDSYMLYTVNDDGDMLPEE